MATGVMNMRLVIANGVTKTYGVDGDFKQEYLAQAAEHRIRVVSGNVDVLATNTPSDQVFETIKAGKTASDQDIYDLPSTYLFKLTANADSVVVISSK